MGLKDMFRGGLVGALGKKGLIPNLIDGATRLVQDPNIIDGAKRLIKDPSVDNLRNVGGDLLNGIVNTGKATIGGVVDNAISGANGISNNVIGTNIVPDTIRGDQIVDRGERLGRQILLGNNAYRAKRTRRPVLYNNINNNINNGE
jgi:hypothetical protein